MGYVKVDQELVSTTKSKIDTAKSDADNIQSPLQQLAKLLRLSSNTL